MKSNCNKGFTLVELLIVIWMIFLIVGVIGFGLIGAVCMGNEWFTTDGVLRQIRVSNPQATEVVTYNRSVFSKSTVTVKLSSGETKIYLLDSDVLFNYVVTPKP